MKNTLLVLLFVASLAFLSCEDKDDSEYVSYLVATPIKADLLTFKTEAVDVTEPVPMVESGKIYAYKNYVFVNDVGRGFHVLDNTDPSNPKSISFIQLEGNFDISIKDDRLFADSYGDLVILDISDINNIGDAKRIENAIYQEFWCTVGWDVAWPEADFYDYSGFDASKEAIVGWEVSTERLTKNEFETRAGYYNLALSDASFSVGAEASAAPSTSTTGQGGSFARFKIVGDYLYAIEWASINVFDISNLDDPKVLEEVYTNGVIETIYNQGDILFLGGTQGMYIYDITTPDKPTYVSEFVHGRACDPVVVDGDYAFVTLRSGNTCGDTESGLYIVDVADLTNPTLKKFYEMDDPYGLGIKQEKLFICDGASGLKVFDKSDINNLQLLNHFKDIVTYDVIPLQNSLLMIGNKVLYQYEYLDNEIRLLSTFALN
ncbi:MAG: LVIVD repeat-containing protein [Flavobacteriaceae bacterium]